MGNNIAKQLPKTGIEFPLIFKRGKLTIARAVIEANKKKGYLGFAGNIKEGELVRFGFGNSENILLESSKVSKNIKSANIETIFIYSCMARRRLMPKLIHKEIEPLTDIAPVSGFFTNGEFYKTKKAQLLNQTMTILALSESDEKSKNKSKQNKIKVDNDYTNTIKSLSHLVSVTSKELTKLNYKLENKNKELKKIKDGLKYEVNRQIKELREKDLILIQQTKLAAMGEMIGNIAHQWRQPLNIMGIKLMTLQTYYQKGLIDDKFMEEHIKSSSDTLQHMSDTIDDFKDFFKPDREDEQFNIYNMLLKSVDVIKDSFKNHNIKFELKGKKDIEVMGYKNEFSQVILNLITNAKDALKANETTDPYIKVDITQIDEKVSICVKDNAGGIPMNIKDKIFEPYFTTKHKSKGTGIGLYMSKMIIENNMNGSLSVSNGNEGASFIICLDKRI